MPIGTVESLVILAMFEMYEMFEMLVTLGILVMSEIRETQGTPETLETSETPETQETQETLPDGISREVIQADICRYLGPDALIKPMEYNGVRGYMVKAYRPFTSEMIADLKQDSLRWQAERDQTDARYGVDYTQSLTHRTRQYYGFSGQGLQTPQMPPGVPVSQGIPAQAAFASYGPGDYTYTQTSVPYQQSTTAYAYPSPSATDYEPPLGPSREPRSQMYAYGQPAPGAGQSRNVVGTDAEAQASYYYATQGQPMPPVSRGQAYMPAQPSYSQPPPRESYPAREPHGAREETGRRRRER